MHYCYTLGYLIFTIKYQKIAKKKFLMILKYAKEQQKSKKFHYKKSTVAWFFVKISCIKVLALSGKKSRSNS